MDLERELEAEAGATSPAGTDGGAIIAPGTGRIGADVSTPLLRRCTALATRARVDLLSGGRTAAEELEQVLATLESWDPKNLVAPDATMIVLAAASLQDLAERLPDPARSTLGPRISAVLHLLHTVMGGSRIDAMA